MGKPSKLLNIAISLSLTLLFLGQQIQASENLELGVISPQDILNQNQYKYYQISIPRDYDKKADLLVKVVTQFSSSDPDVFISKTNTQPSSKETSEWACSSIGKDTCSVHHSLIQPGDVFYIGVTCQKYCKFGVRPVLQREIELSDGQVLQIDFVSYETKLFTFRIPNKELIKSSKGELKSITIAASPFLSFSEDLTLTAATKGVANTASSLKGKPVWSKGQVIQLTDEMPEWCTDCSVSIMVDVQDSGEYNIMAKTGFAVQKIYKDIKLDDVSLNSKDNCYVYIMDNRDLNLKFSFTQYSGIASLYINPGDKALKFDDSMYKMIGEYHYQLILTNEMRQQYKEFSGQFSICVFPHTASSYSILAQEYISKQQNFLLLDDGFQQNGEVQGKQMQIYLYKVPKFSSVERYQYFDFKLSSTSGEQPLLAARFCEDLDYTRCASDIYRSVVFDAQGDWKKAKTTKENLIYLQVEHKSRSCEERDCYYTVVVGGNSDNQNTTRFLIQAKDIKSGHQTLKEGDLVTDFVGNSEMNYYKFSLLGDTSVKTVTFTMNTLHGDADIFVSRTFQKPDRYTNEKGSQESQGFIDQLVFEKIQGDDSISSTYYIGVLGYQYSTYNLKVKVEREGQDNKDYITALIEGIPVKGYLQDKFQNIHYQFEVFMYEGYEKQIRIQLQNLENRVIMYIKQGQQSSFEDYHWSTDSNLIVIDPKDANFVRNGKYFISVYPSYQFWEILYFDLHYSFMISYTSTQQYTYIQTNTAFETNQYANQGNYFRHFIYNQNNNDMKVAVTVFSGTPQFYFGLKDDNKFPTETKNDQPSTFSENFSQGKTYTFKAEDILKLNSACIDGGKTSEGNCVLFIGVISKDDCKYSIRISYDNLLPQQLVIGIPQHDLVREGEYNYYYLIVKKNNQKDIYAVLSTLSGNADLYINLQTNPGKTPIKQWILPSTKDNFQKSTETLAQDVIRIKSTDMEKCFDPSNIQEECALVFGIYGYTDKTVFTKEDKRLESKYNFVVYADVAILQNSSPITNSVEEGRYHYFVYQATCSNCTIIVSLSTYGTGDPDLFITVGNSRLPTKNDFDIGSSTFYTEIIEIDLQQSYFQKNKIKTLVGTYIIAVYGAKNSTYTLSVSQEEHPITTLQNGFPIKYSQDKYDVTYFRFYNWEEKDINIQLDVKSGKADFYVNTFSSQYKDNFNDRLPSSRQKSKWRVDSIKPLSTLEERTLLISTKDRDYCLECYILIGIFSEEEKIDYNIVIESTQANFHNNFFLKLGEPQVQSLTNGQIKIYKFLLDEYAPAKVQITIQSGNIKSSLHISNEQTEFFFATEGDFIYSIEKDDKHFQMNKLYYLMVMGNSYEQSEYTVLVSQDKSIIRLSEGVPLRITFGIFDMQKNMIFKLPEGDSTVQIQVKALQEDSTPKLYYKFFSDISSAIPTIDWPPGGSFKAEKDYDKILGLLKITKEYTGITSDMDAGLAISLFDSSQLHYNEEVAITVSTTNTQQLLLGQMMYGNLSHLSSFQQYKISSSKLNKTGSLVIEIADCIGETSLIVLDAIEGYSYKIRTRSVQQYGKKFIFVPLPLEQVYVKVESKQFDEYQEGGGPRTDYLIKAYTSQQTGIQDRRYAPIYNGTIEYKALSPPFLNLTWGSLYFVDSNSPGLINNQQSDFTKEVTYNVVYSKDQRARLDTVCALQQDYQQQLGFKVLTTKSLNAEVDLSEEEGSVILNVIAQITDHGAFDGDTVPYTPIVIDMSKNSYYFSKVAKYIYGLLIGLFFMCLCVQYVKRQELEKPKRNIPQSRSEFEMTNVRSTGPVQSAGYQPVNVA